MTARILPSYESLASAEIFHVETRSFRSTGSMHQARVAHTATLLDDGRVLIAGGYTGKVSSSAERHDPKTGTFTETGNLSVARCKHTAGLLPDGRVPIAGGSGERGWNANLSSAEIYDPHTGKFTARRSHERQPLQTARRSNARGFWRAIDCCGSKEVEVFDPASETFFVADGRLSDSWHFMSETRLPDGSVLLAGGYPNNDHAIAQAWVYSPRQSWSHATRT
jgi:Kelch motif